MGDLSTSAIVAIVSLSVLALGTLIAFIVFAFVWRKRLFGFNETGSKESDEQHVAKSIMRQQMSMDRSPAFNSSGRKHKQHAIQTVFGK